ncbi:MAG TPA: response regulator, partial [Firmicutes bacterium]|nr:response regulator [Bacillota bacterium]
PIYEYIEIIQKSGKRIVDINEQLLTLGRRGYYKIEIVDLNEIIKKTVSILKFSENIKVLYNLSPDLNKIKGGKSQLIRMITNLLINASDAVHGMGNIVITTKNRKVNLRDRVSKFLEPGEYIMLSIKDNGIGISPELREKIFEPFFTTKEGRIQGTGLGLSIVYSVVEDHKGYIELESKIGQGADFRMYFPVTYEPIAVQDDGEDVYSLPKGSEHILVVDDDKIQLKVVSDLLNRLGYSVSTVNSGEDALYFLKDAKPSLVILDMLMKGIDGVETFRQIRKINPFQKVMILTGYSLSERIKEAVAMGVKRVLKKPITISKLAIAIRNELDEAEE